MEGSKLNKINSELSWNSWRDQNIPIQKLENSFINGWEFSGTNTRYSSQALNKETLLIKHPLIEESFEISIEKFYEISKQSTIKNGVIDLEMALNNSRNPITKNEYLDQLEELKSKKLADELRKSKLVRVNSKDLKVGKQYIRQNGSYTIYFGTFNVNNEIRYTTFDTYNNLPIINKDFLDMFIYQELWSRQFLNRGVKVTKSPPILFESNVEHENLYKYLEDKKLLDSFINKANLNHSKLRYADELDWTKSNSSSGKF